MEFLRQILAKTGDTSAASDELDRALEASGEVAQKMWAVALEGAKPFIDRGEFMGASLVIMASVWAALDTAKGATAKTSAKHGENVVAIVWEMFEATFLSNDEVEARNKLDAIKRRMDGDE